MIRYMQVLITVLLLAASQVIAGPAVRFTSVDVYIDSNEPLAAWQFEFSASGGAMQVVGVENGDSKAFHEAPYYDREAVEQGRADRIVVADYSLEDERELPQGRTRVTTLHLMLSGSEAPEFATRLVVASSYQGIRIDAEISIDVSDGREQ